MEKVKTPAGIPDLAKSAVDTAKAEGAKEYIKDSVAAAMASDTGTTGDEELAAERTKYQVAPDLQSTIIAPLLALPLDEMTNRLRDHPKHGQSQIDFETAKGLLHLERAGRNRTGYVKALMAAIGVKDVRLVTTAGPNFTNDETEISGL